MSTDLVPIDKLPSAKKKAAALGYALAVKAGESFDEEVSASYEKYFKSQRKKLYLEFAEHPELAECMMACAAIPVNEVWDVVAQLMGAGSDDLIASLKEYRRPADKAAKTDAAKKAAETAIAKKQKARAAKLEREALLQEKLQDAEPEVREAFPPGGVDKAIWRAVTEGVRLAYGSGTCSPYALMLLVQLMACPRKEVDTLRLGQSTWLPVPNRERVAFIADRLDGAALSDALESLFFDKGVALALAPLCVFGGEKAVRRIVAAMSDWEYGGTKGRKDINIATAALLHSKTRAAILFFDKYKMLDRYAYHNRTTEDALRDGLLSDFGFDAEGKLALDLGGKVVTATIGDDLKIALFDETEGKPVKSIPKRGSDPERYEEVKAELSQMKKDIKKIVSHRRKLLFEDFLSGRERDAKEWVKAYLGNPVLRSVARLVVWEQDGSFFIVSGTETVGFDGAPFKLGKKPVRVAHPVDMTLPVISGWRDYFARRGLKQPFEQVWERVVDLSTVKPDRYKGIMFKAYRFMRRDAEGIHYNPYRYVLSFDGAKIEYDMPNPRHRSAEDFIEITKFKLRGKSLQRDRGANHLVYYLDKCCFYPRIASNDLTVMEDLNDPSLAQVIEYADIAASNGATELLALLLEYRREHFAEYEDVDSLLLD